MSGIKVVAKGTTQIASSSAKKTLLQLIAPTNQRLVVKEITVSCKSSGYGISGAEDKSAFVEVEEQSTAGTGTSLTLSKWDSTVDETIQSTANHSHSSQPTSGNGKLSQQIHPYVGEAFYWRAPSDAAQDGLIVKGGGRLGIAITHLDASVTWDWYWNVIYEE